MCGIFGYVGKKSNAIQIVLDGLKRLEYRGYDSWGIAIKKLKARDSTLLIEKHVGKISEAKLPVNILSNFAFGHTRWATHGKVTEINAHPHLDCTGKIAIIHNGIIENYDDLKKKLINHGHKFLSETDSEVIAHLIEEFYLDKFSHNRIKNYPKLSLEENSEFKEAVRKAFLKLKGLNAIIAMDSELEEFVAAKTGSPLVIGFGQNENFLASDAPALLPYTKKVYFLEDNEIVLVKKDQIILFEAKNSKRKKPKIQTLDDWRLEETQKGKYPHFMIKEIMEQPRILREIAKNSAEQIYSLAQVIKKSYGTYMIGCGSAFYAALAGTYFFSRIARRHVNAAAGSEFGYIVDFLTNKSLVIALSQSGETIDIIESVKKAIAKGAKILAVVNNLGSTLYRMADYKILLGAGPEKCVLATKSFTAKLAILLLFAYVLNGGLEKGKKLLEKAINEIENILKPKKLEQINLLAKKISNKDHIYVIGRGQSYPVALEAALKIKEVSYIHAEGFPAGELKHGVIALIEKETPCLVFAPNDETYGAVLSGAMEMKARGGYIVGVSFKNHEVFDYFIPVRDCGDASTIPNTIVAQLLGYYLALEKGNDPDKPRNLAKSVTVK